MPSKRELNPISSRQKGVVCVKDNTYVDFSSNDYLGVADLASNKESTFSNMIRQYGFGATGSRLLSGDYDIFHQLETEIAALKHKESALLFNSGYQCNIGVISSLYGKGDLIILDKQSHASLIDGARLSEASFCRFKHNDTEHLHDLLKRKRTQFKRVLIVTESLFSMDGDFAPIKEIIQLKNDFDAELLIDEAHATGVFGDRGQGLITSKQAPDIEYIVGTFGKAFGSSGAYLLCNNTVKNHIINHCRSFIYSTAMPPLIAAITLQQLHLIKTMDQEREQLIDVAQYFKEQLNILGYTMLGDAHIISVIVGDEDAAVSLSQKLKDAGFWALPIRPPTVAKGTSRIRLSFTAHHKKDMLVPLIEFFKKNHAIHI